MEVRLLSSLDKVFFDLEPAKNIQQNHSIFKNEIGSFQIAVYFEGGETEFRHYVNIKVVSKISDLIEIRQVRLMPSMFPAYGVIDDNYLDVSRSLYPDLLEKTGTEFHFTYKKWHSLWVDVCPKADTSAGEYPLTFEFYESTGEKLAELSTTVSILPYELPAQTLIRTEWFHVDCLADFYNEPAYSERHWNIIKNFMDTAFQKGINMIFMPIFTPPLDTEKGGERTNVQLVDISFDGKFHFDYSKLRMFIETAKSVGFQYFEVSHFFTQWGCENTPMVLVNVDGVPVKMFGWHTDATSLEYSRFLKQFIPDLRDFLKNMQIDEQCYFHISDEPELKHLEQFTKVHEIISELLAGCKVIDALSEPDFYLGGLVQTPVIATDHFEKFKNIDLKEPWVYYCCAQNMHVSNRFMAMPSARNRIIGVQLYIYQISGFLHWGYNFYNTMYSKRHINPYITTDGDCFSPSGDPFIVYPGPDGKPVESLRLVVFAEAMYDLRALEMLEKLTSRDFVMDLIHEGLDEKITFKKYPKSAEYLYSLRNRVNEEIMKRLK